MFKKSLALLLFSFFLTATTYVLGAAPLLALRRLQGPIVYWIWVAVAIIGFGILNLLPMGSFFFMIALLVSVFCELHERGKSLYVSAIYGVSFCTALGFGGVSLFQQMTGTKFLPWVTEQLNAIINDPRLSNLTANIKVETVIEQLPAILVISFILALWMGLLLEGPIFRFFVTKEKKIERYNLKVFKIPSFFLWGLTASVAGAFMEHNFELLKIVSANVFNVILTLYFLQGMAVMGAFFQWSKVGTFWRMLLYALMIFQLFPLLSVVGLLEGWFDLRSRMTKKSTETGNTL